MALWPKNMRWRIHATIEAQGAYPGHGGVFQIFLGRMPFKHVQQEKIASSFPARLDQRSAGVELGGAITAPWKTENRVKLKMYGTLMSRIIVWCP